MVQEFVPQSVIDFFSSPSRHEKGFKKKKKIAKLKPEAAFFCFVFFSKAVKTQFSGGLNSISEYSEAPPLECGMKDKDFKK